MSVIYDAINDFLISEKGKAIVSGSEEKAFNVLRSVQEQHGFTTSQDYYDFLRPDEDKWMEDNFAGNKDAKHPGTGKRHGWKYRTYMPAKYWNSRTVIGAAIDKGIDITGMGKSAIQKATTGDKDDSSTETISTNLSKFKKSWLKVRDYFHNLDFEGRSEAIRFMTDNSL